MTDQPKVERTYLEIKRRIIEGQYRPGVHLSESMLARIHHSSRTPVREALSRLLQQGYVEFVPKRGYAAAPITVAVVRDMFEVRRLLEGAAAARAAAAVTAEDAAHLHSVADCDYVPATQRATYLTALDNNQQFHISVAKAGRNGFLVDLIELCLGKMDRVLSRGIDYAPFRDRVTVEHRRIVDAICQA